MLLTRSSPPPSYNLPRLLIRLVRLSRLRHARLLPTVILIPTRRRSRTSRWLVRLVVVPAVGITASRRLGGHWCGVDLVSACTTATTGWTESTSCQSLAGKPEEGGRTESRAGQGYQRRSGFLLGPSGPNDTRWNSSYCSSHYREWSASYS